MTKLSVRLNDERENKLTKLAEQRGDISKAETIRQLIDNADSSTQTLTDIRSDIRQIKDAVGATDDIDSTPADATPDAGVSKSTAQETMPATPDQSASTPTMIATDGGGPVTVDKLSPAHVTQHNLIIPANDYSSDLPESVHKTMGLLVGVLNWLRENQPYDGRELDEIDRAIEMTIGRGDDTVIKYRNRLINQGYAFVSPLLDPMLTARWDDLLVKIYGGSEYQKLARRGMLDEDTADLFGGWWLEEMANSQVYLDVDEYTTFAENLLSEIEDKILVRWSSADRREDRSDAWDAWRVIYVELCRIASSRSNGEIDSKRHEQFLRHLANGEFADEETWNEWFASSRITEMPVIGSEEAAFVPSLEDGDEGIED